MAFNLTVEDSSPLVSYAPGGAWLDNPSNDTLISLYSASSLHTTSVKGATATINFNGTGIWLYGGMRPEYGTYTMSVDGQTTKTGSAQSSSPLPNQLLGAAVGLEHGPHTVVLTNTGSGSGVDLDSFIFQGQVGSGGSYTNTTLDDMDSGITYAPSTSDWQINTQPNLNYNNTLHFTSTPRATATLPFSGDAIAVYGTVSPDHANIQISLDGKLDSVQGGAEGFASVLHTQTLLYYADNLGPQQHQLILSSDQSSGTGKYLDIDSVTVYSSGGSAATDPNNANAPSASSVGSHAQSSSHRNRLEMLPVIIGIIAGAVALLLLLGALFFFLHRRRQNRRRSFLNSPLTPALPIQNADMMEAGLRSAHFSEVRLSPGGHPPGPPQVMAFPLSRSGSTSSYRSTRSTTAMIDKTPARLNLPEQPPPTVTRGGNGIGINMGTGAPSRPTRPPSLLLSPKPWMRRQ